MPRRHGGAVVTEHAPQAHQRVVDVGDLGRLGLLVAADRTDEVALQAVWRDREARKPDAGEAVPHAVEGRAPCADHEHPLAVAHQRADGVDHGLRAAGAGQRVDDERLAVGHARKHALLFGVGVQQQHVGRGRALVGAGGHRPTAVERERLAVGDVTRQGVQHAVVEV